MSAFDILNRFFRLPVPEVPQITGVRVLHGKCQNVSKIHYVSDIRDILDEDEMIGLVKIKQRVIREGDVIKVVTYYKME